MSSSSHGADAPRNPNIEWALRPDSPDPPEPEAGEQDNLEDASDEEYDHLYGPSVQVRASNAPEQVPGQVDQFSDPTEAPEEFHMEYVKEQGVTGFMVKVSTRLRTLKAAHERGPARHRFMDLMGKLKVDDTAQPPYNQAVAYQIRHLLEERGLGESLLLDFELLLHVFEERAQTNKEQAEKRKQEIEEEERKKQEWDMVKEDDADDEWEMV